MNFHCYYLSFQEKKKQIFGNFFLIIFQVIRPRHNSPVSEAAHSNFSNQNIYQGPAPIFNNCTFLVLNISFIGEFIFIFYYIHNLLYKICLIQK